MPTCWEFRRLSRDPFPRRADATPLAPPGWVKLRRIPADAPEPPASHPQFGAPVSFAPYHDTHGRVLGLLARFHISDKRHPRFRMAHLCVERRTGWRAWLWSDDRASGRNAGGAA